MAKSKSREKKKKLKQIRTLHDLEQYEQSIGPRIAIAREHMGMSVDDLAARLGVEPASVRAWEADERTPRANRLLMLAGILDVSLLWLLEGREDGRLTSEEAPGIEELRARLVLARGLFSRGLAVLESVEHQLDVLAAREEEVDPSEVED